MRFLLSLSLVLSLTLPALAQQIPPQPRSLPTAKQVGDIVFKEVEKRVIKEFFGKKSEKTAGDGGKKKAKKAKKGKGRGRGKGLPPGLAKRKSLPPGLAKKSLPPGLDSKLGNAPPGTERIIAGDDVVLLEKATGKILDVIEGVLRGK